MSSITLQIGLIFLILTCAFAWVRGGAGERAGATAVALAWIISLVVYELIPAASQPIALLSVDVALAAALLVIAIRYSSHWLGAAMLLQAVMLTIHAEQLSEDGIGHITYFIVLNLASYAMLLTIVASTIGAWMKRTRQHRAEAKPPGVATPI